jgi:hypothetical protein
MRTSKFSETQIITILKQGNAGLAVRSATGARHKPTVTACRRIRA